MTSPPIAAQARDQRVPPGLLSTAVAAHPGMALFVLTISLQSCKEGDKPMDSCHALEETVCEGPENASYMCDTDCGVLWYCIGVSSQPGAEHIWTESPFPCSCLRDDGTLSSAEGCTSEPG